MVIEKVHGLHATSMSLSDRFTMLSSVTPVTPNTVVAKPKRRTSINSYLNLNLNNMNRNLLQEIARRLEQQAKRIVYQQAMQQRLGTRGGLRHFGSEGNLPGLKRSNSFGNLSQQSSNNRAAWRQSNGNLSRSVSFNNLSNRLGGGRQLRGFRRRGRGGVQRPLRGRFRGGKQGLGAVQGVQRSPRPQVARRGSAFRGRGRGGVSRSQPPRPVPSKEELDAQLEQYMACTKAALDRELDDYMKAAMDLE